MIMVIVITVIGGGYRVFGQAVEGAFTDLGSWVTTSMQGVTGGNTPQATATPTSGN